MTWQETIAPDESARFEAYAQELRVVQQQHASKSEHTQARALHTKSHLGAVGTLTIGAVPDALRAGVFATPRTYSVFVRFSNGGPGRHSDRKPDVRGIGLKLVGVEGAKIIAGLEGALTQDFLLIPVAALPVRDPHEFMTLLRLGQRGQALLVPRLIGALGFRRALSIVRGALKIPKIRSMATTRFYTGAPLLIGDVAVKLAMFPAANAAPATPGKGPDALREDLVTRLKAGPIRYTLYAQCFVDEATTPIEDSAVVWPENTSPQIPLAELVLPAQDVTSEAGKAIESQVESLSFDPWHALPAHRPLGAIMRARAPAYRESVMQRGAAAEPTEVPPHG